MAKMGRGSRSFLRYREYAAFFGEAVYMETERKKGILDFLHRFEYNDRAVYFAENLQTMTEQQMQAHVEELSGRLHSAGAHGVVEFHPTADGTSKSAHIHYWGQYTDDVEAIIVDYIKENRLSNKTYLNYTNEEMRADTEHKIVKGKLVEYSFGRDEEKITRETVREVEIDEEKIAARNQAKKETFYDDIIAYCDDILEQLEVDVDIREKAQESVDIDINDIYRFILEMEYDLYE